MDCEQNTVFRTCIHQRATRILSYGLLCFACCITHLGCISIQHAPKSMRISNRTAQASEVRAPTDFAGQWIDRLSPHKIVHDDVKVWFCESQQKSADWIAVQRARHQSHKAAMHAWIQRKKEDANQPPWPRFHPIPAKPVFEPSEETLPMDPEIYGRFGISE